MADAKDRALSELVAMLAPAAAVSVTCPHCRSVPGDPCVGYPFGVWCSSRTGEAANEVRRHLRTLFEI